ncbi:MAG: ferritin-like domain-containing protein [Verrucomicrobiota bacterium]|jgi:ferritin-like metal-binding protein YciE
MHGHHFSERMLFGNPNKMEEKQWHVSRWKIENIGVAMNKQKRWPKSKLKILFLNELADMYDAEMRIIRALPKLAHAATCEHLQAAFLAHLEETKGHEIKIRQVFSKFGEKPRGRKCAATIGLIQEGEKTVAENRGEPTLNAALISVGQKVEHYEIASYGCLHEWAKLLDNEDAVRLLEEILTQEKACDETLKDLAKEKNQEALNPDSDASALIDLTKTIPSKAGQKTTKGRVQKVKTNTNI